jgi:S-adenosylmethionine:tRNA ribosyltransferase-isomerase
MADACRVIGDFTMPSDLEAAEPPEARGLRRDEVRLLVSDVGRDAIEHARFLDLPCWLSTGDLLVVNTSGTLNASLPVRLDGEALELHVSTRLPGGFWVVEMRRCEDGASLPYRGAHAGVSLRLPAGGQATLLAPYPARAVADSASRLWLAALHLPCGVLPYLDRYGAPIRYRYVKASWPGSMYQTVFATEPGSAEMPSAGRPFTPELVTRLVTAGIEIAPLLLHTGVSSLEDHEPPYEEFFRVPHQTAARINAARRAGRRVVAVGTTVVRALETVTDERGITSPGEGWTAVVITAEKRLRSVDALITGFHEPQSTHLTLLERVIAAARPHRSSARGHLARAYDEARRRGYLWHEFGDSHLIIGPRRRLGSFGETGSRFDEGEEIRVDHVLVDGAKPVRQSRIDLQR